MHQAQHQYPSTMPSVSAHHYHSRPTATRVASTEFRGSTNPDEDWTKISDLAERRRIQNRIAQRNYRKKLKRRLEDLERRAASRSISPNEDTDGRSTRESSAEHPLQSPPPSSEPHLSRSPPSRDSYLPSASSSYTYSSNYRTAGGYPPSYAPSFTPSESSSNYYYPHATTGASHSHLPAISDLPSTSSAPSQSHFNYPYSHSNSTLSSVLDATCNAPVTTSSSEHYGLPLPTTRGIPGYASIGPEYAPIKTASYDSDPFCMSYTSLADTPSYFYGGSSSSGGQAIKQETS